MTHTRLGLLVSLVLATTGFLVTRHASILLPPLETTLPFEVGIHELPQAGGCLWQYNDPCPAVGQTEDEICHCNDENHVASCQQTQGTVVLPDWTIPRVGWPDENFNGIGINAKINVTVLCASAQACMPPCEYLMLSGYHQCDYEHLGIEDDYRLGDEGDGYTLCSNTNTARQTRESRVQRQVAMGNGFHIQLFSER